LAYFNTHFSQDSHAFIFPENPCQRGIAQLVIALRLPPVMKPGFAVNPSCFNDSPIFWDSFPCKPEMFLGRDNRIELKDAFIVVGLNSEPNERVCFALDFETPHLSIHKSKISPAATPQKRKFINDGGGAILFAEGPFQFFADVLV
jgi:hypothetical protein